jgi:hypothetical protein
MVRKCSRTPDGRQYVLDDADERVYGEWLPPADEARIVPGGE